MQGNRFPCIDPPVPLHPPMDAGELVPVHPPMDAGEPVPVHPPMDAGEQKTKENRGEPQEYDII